MDPLKDDFRVEPLLATRPTTQRPRSLRVILASLAADGTLAVAKIIAATLSGSAAMFAEAMHSVADTTNQSLLLVGRALSAKPADAAHPFGYGKERYFWPFIVSIVIFVLGGTFSVLRGIGQIRNPHELEHLQTNYAVLAIAFILEGLAWIVAWVELKRSGKHRPIMQLIRESKSPAIIAVFLQDAAAVIGVVIAAAFLWWAQTTGLWIFDGIASIAIGALLFNVSWVIGKETKSLLIGESASAEDIRRIRDVVEATYEVDRVLDLLTMHMGPEDILVNLDLQFRDGLTTDDIEIAIDNIEKSIREAVPEVRKIFIEAESIATVARKGKSSRPPHSE